MLNNCWDVGMIKRSDLLEKAGILLACVTYFDSFLLCLGTNSFYHLTN